MRSRFHGHMTMTPKRTGRAPSHGKDRATAANANTTERSANLLETFHKQLQIRPKHKRQSALEGERVRGMKRRVVSHHHRAGVRSAAHIEFHTGYCFVAGGTGERCQRVLIPTSSPTTMRDEVHATYRRRSRELPLYCADP